MNNPKSYHPWPPVVVVDRRSPPEKHPANDQYSLKDHRPPSDCYVVEVRMRTNRSVYRRPIVDNVDCFDAVDVVDCANDDGDENLSRIGNVPLDRGRWNIDENDNHYRSSSTMRAWWPP